MIKSEWKYFYRIQRIIKRESLKTTSDMMIYGSGFINVTGLDVEHVPFINVYNTKIK